MRVFAAVLTLGALGLCAGTSKNETLSKLEKLVSSIADGQDEVSAAPQPVPSDVIILEEEEERLSRGRALSRCSCSTYLEGARAGDINLCVKANSGECRPYNGGCASDMTYCSEGPVATTYVQASPSATVQTPNYQRSRNMDQEAEFTYLNMVLELAAPSVTSFATLPSVDAFAAVFAAKGGVTSSRVQVSTTFGLPAQTALQGGSPSTTSTASVHMTLHARNRNSLRALEASFREMSVVTVDSIRFSVLNFEVYPATDYPLVCTPRSETIKAETRDLLQQLVDLKRQEVQMLSNALTGGTETCSSPTLSALADHIGLRLPK